MATLELVEPQVGLATGETRQAESELAAMSQVAAELAQAVPVAVTTQAEAGALVGGAATEEPARVVVLGAVSLAVADLVAP